jgi:hypothetical protein
MIHKTRQTLRHARHLPAVAGLVTAFVLALATPALAGQFVYDQANQIVASNDDGTNAHVLVPLASAAGMQLLENPNVSPNGGTAVVFDGIWNQADAEATSWSPVAPGACGAHCAGVYELTGGTLSRLSPAPLTCQPIGFPCASFEQWPTIGPSGNVLDTFIDYQEQESCIGTCGWNVSVNYDTIGTPGRALLASTQPGDVAVECNGGGYGEPDFPDISPDGTKLAYTNCQPLFNYVTEISSVSGSGSFPCTEDSTAIDGPSWSLDGTKIVESEYGGDTALWVYPVAASSCNPGYKALTYDANSWGLQSPRFIGGGRIAFVAIANGAPGGDVYTIADTCGKNGTPCTFPASAHKVTTGGGIYRVAWTSATAPLAAAGNVLPDNSTGPSAPAGGGSNTGGGGSTSGGGSSTGGGSTTSKPGSSTPGTTPGPGTTTTKTVTPAVPKALLALVIPLLRAHHAAMFHGPKKTLAGQRIKAWAWSFGDHSHGRGASVHHTYRQAGHFTLTLTVTLASGKKITLTETVAVKH